MVELSLAEEYILGHYNERAIREIADATKAIFRQIFYREKDKANVIFCEETVPPQSEGVRLL